MREVSPTAVHRLSEDQIEHMKIEGKLNDKDNDIGVSRVDPGAEQTETQYNTLYADANDDAQHVDTESNNTCENSRDSENSDASECNEDEKVIFIPDGYMHSDSESTSTECSSSNDDDESSGFGGDEANLSRTKKPHGTGFVPRVLQGLQSTFSKPTVVTYEEITGNKAGMPVQLAELATQSSPKAAESSGASLPFYHPFDNEVQYGLATYFYQTMQSKGDVDRFFDSPWLSDLHKIIGPGFQSSKQWDQKMHAISDGIDADHFKTATISGEILADGIEPVKHKILYRHTLEVVKFLISFPPFQDELTYAPVHLLNKRGERVYNELQTARSWEETQGKIPVGATVVPVFLSSDKTMLSQHHGDVSAWPVYMTIGNLNRGTRRDQTVPGSILVGLIPTSTKDHKAEIYHRAMSLITEPLLEAGVHGTEIKCADGNVRLCFPILFSQIGDYEEQVLVTGIANAACPICRVPLSDRENLLGGPWKQRTHEYTRSLIAQQRKQGRTKIWVHDVENYAWSLPHVNIHEAMTVDLLHQLQKGIVSHLLSWTVELVSEIHAKRVVKGSTRSVSQLSGSHQLDLRFMMVPSYTGLKSFRKGISGVKQWTGVEQKGLMRQYVAVLAPLLTSKFPAAMMCVRAILDFVTVAMFHTHDEDTLRFMKDALERIDILKIAFARYRPIDKKTQQRHFNFPKFHSMTHYIENIRKYGAPDGTDTSHSEAAHKYNVKEYYGLTNKREDFLDQLALLNVRRVKALSMQAVSTHAIKEKENLQKNETLDEDSRKFTCPSDAISLRKIGIFPTQNEADYAKRHRLSKGFWCQASHVAQTLQVSRFVDALAIFVKNKRGEGKGLPPCYDLPNDTSWAAKMYVCIHPSITTWKPDGKDPENLERLVNEKIRCSPRWMGQSKWRNDYVWIQSDDEDCQDVPLQGRIAGQLKLTFTVYDAESLQVNLPRVPPTSAMYCGSLIELLRPLNRGAPHKCHGLVEFQSWDSGYLTSRTANPVNLRIFPMSHILRSAHIVPSNLKGRFYINHYIDWHQFNTFYDPQFHAQSKEAAVQAVARISEELEAEAEKRKTRIAKRQAKAEARKATRQLGVHKRKT